MRPILEASIQNCHVAGLDSIVFKASAPMVRVYIAREDHVLWRNLPSLTETMSLGLHQHRTAITMTPLFGEVDNVVLAIGGEPFGLFGYSFKSRICDGVSGFEPLYGGKAALYGLKTNRLKSPTYMRGTDMHSVHVPRGRMAAWLICEGAPNESYDPALLTNDQDPASSSSAGLYVPMTRQRLDENMAILTAFSGEAI